ncbi:hypothetical protein [Leucobacter sp. GX24907]
MQELFGRVAALDSEASESLKVIAYFDALVAGDVGVESLTRGAAVLSGVTAGAEVAGRMFRITPEGRPAAPGPDTVWPTEKQIDADTRVWLERVGTTHANDTMILERFSFAVTVLQARRRAVADDPVLAVIDATRPESQRLSYATRLRLDSGRWRVIASLPEGEPLGSSTLVATPHGIVRASIVSEDHLVEQRPAGLGPVVEAADLTRSWADARLALRLTDADHDSVDASDLGILTSAVRGLEQEAERSGIQHPDVRALLSLPPQRRRMLDALARFPSVRAAASALGFHHSTLQSFHEAVTPELGYDPRSPEGYARYEVAALLARLEEPIWTPPDL